jgi:5'-3' exonuclease
MEVVMYKISINLKFKIEFKKLLLINIIIMGIKNLKKLLRKHCPQVLQDIHLSEYAYQKIAIDITLFLCKFKAVCGDRWVFSFINLVSCLRRNEIHAIFIFDTSSPIEKAAEKEERQKRQRNIEEKVVDLEYALDNYHKTGEIEQILIDLHEKIKKEDKTPPPKRLLSSSTKPNIDMKAVENKIKKMNNYILNISEEDFELARELFTILKVPFYNAPLEAEVACADLCKRGIVDSVLTEDTDVLACGANIFLSNINTQTNTCTRIKYSEVLTALKLTDTQFLDLCIMCGCDFNKNIPKVGHETAYKLLLKHGSIEEIGKKTKYDISILNHVRTREIFTEYDKLDIKSVPFCAEPDFDSLQKFIIKHKINVDFEKLKQNYINDVVVVFDEENNNGEEEEYTIVIEDDD